MGISEKWRENGMEWGIRPPEMKGFSFIWDGKAYKNTCHICHRFRLFLWQALGFVLTVALCCLLGVSKPSAWVSECHFHDARESRRTDVCFTGMQMRRSRGDMFVVLSNCQKGRVRRISPLLPSLRPTAGWPTGLCRGAATGW